MPLSVYDCVALPTDGQGKAEPVLFIVIDQRVGLLIFTHCDRVDQPFAVNFFYGQGDGLFGCRFVCSHFGAGDLDDLAFYRIAVRSGLREGSDFNPVRPGAGSQSSRRAWRVSQPFLQQGGSDIRAVTLLNILLEQGFLCQKRHLLQLLAEIFHHGSDGAFLLFLPICGTGK
ncbi:hypothetical protein SDC9_206864 [bioreactor metagenome]|uniref:Uncharacterized protein n=1 Tax=bioreactor metagenome TaxID=1076179 RepID=A0A645JFM4_9ZZZZ